MPEELAEGVTPLTRLTEDEAIFRDSVREFAETQIRPLVREMDEHAKVPRALLDGLFDLGVMGIEIPDAYGGQGGNFFHAVLAVEAISQVDPSIGVLVDVQNTLVINALLRWGHEDIKRRYLPRLASNAIEVSRLSVLAELMAARKEQSEGSHVADPGSSRLVKSVSAPLDS